MINRAEQTAQQLKLIANPYRLMILCSLVEGQKNVSELAQITGASQTLTSNHLNVLKKAGVVDFDRDHRTLNYYLADERMKTVLTTLHSVYCQTEQ